ncbi:hypothetical protein FAI40_01235 [Acetobacteraceae bacterium]|nr:hypothetical protein FAI40_01235 [Acetobacteraceae bacterium]
MKNSKKKALGLKATFLVASAFFLTNSGAAYALPASLDMHTALISNNFTLKNKAGEIYSKTADAPVSFEAYSKALKGDNRAAKKLLKEIKKKNSVGSDKVEARQNGKNISIRSQDCHYKLSLVRTDANEKGVFATYQLSKGLPQRCSDRFPVSATEAISLKARLINTPKGVYQLPVRADGGSTSTVLAPLSPTDTNDAGLFGYTYFLKYADGSSLNWSTAGVMSNKLVLGKSHMTTSYLVADAVGQGAAHLSKVGIRLGSSSLESPTLRVVSPKPCDYQMFLDKPSIHRKEGSLSVDFQAPKLSGNCLQGKNPLSVTMGIESLNIDPDGTNKMVVENLGRDAKASVK